MASSNVKAAREHGGSRRVPGHVTRSGKLAPRRSPWTSADHDIATVHSCGRELREVYEPRTPEATGSGVEFTQWIEVLHRDARSTRVTQQAPPRSVEFHTNISNSPHPSCFSFTVGVELARRLVRGQQVGVHGRSVMRVIDARRSGWIPRVAGRPRARMCWGAPRGGARARDVGSLRTRVGSSCDSHTCGLAGRRQRGAVSSGDAIPAANVWSARGAGGGAPRFLSPRASSAPSLGPAHLVHCQETSLCVVTILRS